MKYTYKKKVISLSELLKNISNNRNGRTIVFTNGCFDIIHSGHISYLRESRQLGDLLVVGLNSDKSVKLLKGANRPINRQEDRAMVLEAMDFVDYIVIFDEDTPFNIITLLKPDVYTKAGDYSLENMIGPGLGVEVITNYGGTVKLMPFIRGYSSTNVINRIKGGNNDVL